MFAIQSWVEIQQGGGPQQGAKLVQITPNNYGL